MSSPTADMIPFGGLFPPCVTPARREVVVPVRVRVGTDCAERLQQDHLLLSRQARELAEQAGTIRALTARLARAEATPPIEVTPPAAAVDHAPDPRRIEPIEHSDTAPDITPRKTVVLPTVFTNLGSLLDVFA